MPSDETERTWRDVRRLLNDLKADGYEPVALEAVPSDARKKKSVYINVERSVDTGTQHGEGQR